MKAWDVLRGGGRIDTVYYSDGLEADYVKRTLVDHDGYPENIHVRPSTGPTVGGDQRRHAAPRPSPRRNGGILGS